MVYKVFLSTVKETLQEELGKEFQVSLRQVTKNNGLTLDGASIQKIGEQIAPTIYLNSYFEQYKDGLTIDEIVCEVLHIYQDNIVLPRVDLEQLNDFHLLKDKVAFKLIHADFNSELLKQIPHIPYLDLAIVFYLLLDESEVGQMTALVCHDHIALWECSIKELYELSLHNTPSLFAANIKSMIEVMKAIAKENLGNTYSEELIDDLLQVGSDPVPLYVLTNRSGLNGSCCILYHNILKNFADSLAQDLIILPSSIHEVLLLPYSNDLCLKHLTDMVIEINQSEVPKEDRLSNHVYLYQRSTNQVSIVS